METLLSLVSVTNQGQNSYFWRQVIEMSEGLEQQQHGGLPGGGRGFLEEAGLGPEAQDCPSEGRGELQEATSLLEVKCTSKRARHLLHALCGCNDNSSYDY